jgi:hypothetical protein
MIRDITEPTVATTLQYTVDSLDDFRATAYNCGLQAMDKAHERTLTPIYFSSNPGSTGFDLHGSQATVATSQNYYKIKNTFAKI